MSHRLEQVSSLIRKEMAALIGREIEIPLGTLVTVSRVKLGPDFKFAKIFVNVTPVERAEEVLDILKKNRSRLQKELSSYLTMKFSAKISFVFDAEEAEAQKIESLLDQISRDKL